MKYIDADKFIEVLEEMKKAEYENCGGVNAKTRILQEVQELIPSLQQEQPEVDLEKEIAEHAINMPHSEFAHDSECREDEEWAMKEFRYFYEFGLNARKV